jgi:two-component system, NarL family, nitrate/nitrite response regulator NarL
MNHSISRAQVAVAAVDSQCRARLTGALRSDPSLSIIGEASDEAGLFSLARRARKDILFLDSILADRINGTAGSWSSTRIILVADSITRESVVQALRLGARGIVSNTSPPQVVVNSIETVLADQYWLDTDAIAILFGMIRQLLVGQLEQFDNERLALTPREVSVVTMIVGGGSNKEIGQQLSISERTVKHHLTNIFAKLGISSRLQLANFAVTQGLVRDVGRSTRPQAASSR